MIAARLVIALLILLPGVGVAADVTPLDGGQAPQQTGLSEIIPTISPDQVVGHPFQTTAQLILLDSTSQLLTEYNLFDYPIWLTPALGSLTPAVLDDSTLFSGCRGGFLPALVT